MKKKIKNLFDPLILMGLVLFFTGNCKKDSANDSANTVTDIDGNVYHLVTIGSQVWTVENLKVRHYRNGDTIYNGSGLKSAAVTDSTGTYWAFENNPRYIDVYGLLYNWYAATDKRCVAPIGFHVPSDDEFGALVTSLGGKYNLYGTDTVAGLKLKEKGTEHWGVKGDKWSNAGATNSSEWTGLPGGFLTWDRLFGGMTQSGAWWSSTSVIGMGNSHAYLMVLSSNKPSATQGFNFKIAGMSVKCIQDKW
jgi:uncharacterized protein (TIGR02145 family)